jgi:hypothetical protein
MSYIKIHEHHHTMTRLEVALELRRPATQLDWKNAFPMETGLSRPAQNRAATRVGVDCFLRALRQGVHDLVHRAR